MVIEDETFRRLCRSRDFLAASLDQRVVLVDAASEACLSPFHYHRMFARAKEMLAPQPPVTERALPSTDSSRVVF